MTSIAEQSFGRRQGIEYRGRAFVVAHLAFAEQHHSRTAHFIAHRMQLGVHASFSAPNMAGNGFFLNKLAAVRWALKCVASTISRTGLDPLPASSENPVEHVKAVPADEAVVDRVVRAIILGRVTLA